MKTYVIVNMSYRFAAVRGRRIDWVSEYPDATEFQTISEARGIMRALKAGGPCCNIFSLIESYGLESQRTLQRLDMLESTPPLTSR